MFSTAAHSSSLRAHGFYFFKEKHKETNYIGINLNRGFTIYSGLNLVLTRLAIDQLWDVRTHNFTKLKYINQSNYTLHNTVQIVLFILCTNMVKIFFTYYKYMHESYNKKIL